MLARHPAVALPLERRRGRGQVVDERTDIVLEGFPGSANSFAVAAFSSAQEPKPCRIAHHTHAPAQVLHALELGVPAVVLIRNPHDAVLSQLARSRSLRAASVLRAYIRFYEPLVPHRKDFVVAPFGIVISDFTSVIADVNERFGTSFERFAHSEDDVRRVTEAIERHHRDKHPTSGDDERLMPLPSAVRDELKRTREAELTRAPRELRERAARLFEALAAKG